ncbi:MAG: co-chaperone GroES [Clostridia bacterium]|nr:co-chaperone GroES [Clostridia bacterium]
MKIRPLGEMVLLRPVEQEQVSVGGIIIPDSAKEKPMMAIVEAVGPGGMVDGKEITMVLKEGDKVVYRRYAGTEIKLDGVDYVMTRQSEVIGVVTE